MKSLAGVLILLVLVATVAVTGSQAKPIPRTNPALRVCQQRGPIAPDSVRCRPVALLATSGDLERELAGDVGGDWANEVGGDYSDPDFLVEAAKALLDLAVKAGVVAAVGNLVQRGLDWAFGNNTTASGPALAQLDNTIFDPEH